MEMKKVFTKKSEREIIEHINGLLGLPADKHLIKGIGDDCAVLRKDQQNCFLVS
jgi:thiamine monophosphate kinase